MSNYPPWGLSPENHLSKSQERKLFDYSSTHLNQNWTNRGYLLQSFTDKLVITIMCDGGSGRFEINYAWNTGFSGRVLTRKWRTKAPLKAMIDALRNVRNCSTQSLHAVITSIPSVLNFLTLLQCMTPLKLYIRKPASFDWYHRIL